MAKLFGPENKTKSHCFTTSSEVQNNPYAFLNLRHLYLLNNIILLLLNSLNIKSYYLSDYALISASTRHGQLHDFLSNLSFKTQLRKRLHPNFTSLFLMRLKSSKTFHSAPLCYAF